MFKTKVMMFKVVLQSMKPCYAIVGFDLHGGGGQVGALNAPWFSQAVFLSTLLGF